MSEETNGETPPVDATVLSVHLDLDLTTGALKIHAPEDPIRSLGIIELAKFQLLMKAAGVGQPKPDDRIIKAPPGLLSL